MIRSTPARMARLAAAAALTTAALALAGCSATPNADSAAAGDGDTQVLKVAATTTPMPEVVRAAAEAIEAPYSIELVEVADYVQPNTMLAAGELDANFVQHPPFMEDFNAGNNASLVAIEPVYLTVVGTYSSKHDSMEDIPDGGHIVVPQDVSNQSRALQMYAAAGLIKLDPKVDTWEVTVKDVIDNPKNLQFTEVDLMQLNAAYPEADGVFLHGTFARQLGLVPGEDAIAVEQDPQFAVSLVSRNDNQDSPEVKALAKAFHSDEVRAVLEEFDVPAAF
ncbi:MetQ/NlpA family ABC transporter substrate-binding protein [Leucobacter aridicollis]|uniref:MetQ/NlpA family ABC transporter substrate-binding protein n=1 Tax=Leucobacter aridicollis TaxID=283878 RepID=UPI002169BDFD|nr:MetQ/NlpA family ABC transporter substrate-binding protein [Leucobacter aridicollis]MCS3426940.1 D-methionine transport system substrate-binding protein [Leucobacter aridicollis]